MASGFPFLLAQHQGLQVADFVVIAIYLAGILAAGWYFSKQQEAQDDYFVAGRSMPWLAVGLSIVATMLSTVTYLAAPGEVIKHGLAMSIGWLAIPIAFLVVNFLWVPFFMRLGVTSIYEYLEARFGLAARLLAVLLFVLILRQLWMATIVLTASSAVAQITHHSLERAFGWGITIEEWTWIMLLAVGLLATFYTMLGGIKAVIWTDVAQFIALCCGVILTPLFVAWHTGTGPVQWWAAVSEGAGHEFPPLISWDITTRNTIAFAILNAVFWYSCTFIGDQVAVQRYLTTSSVRAAVKGNIVNFVADFLVMVMLAVCGMALLTYYLDPRFATEIMPGVSDPRQVADRVFPRFIEDGLPAGISGLVVAALFAVAMSSLDSGINSVAAVVTVDVFKRLGSSRFATQDSLLLPRIITLVVGLSSTLLAIAMLSIPERYNIIGITARTFNCALGPLGAMFVVGMFFRRSGQVAVVGGAIVGLAVAVGSAWWVEIMWMLGPTPYVTLAEATEKLSGPSPFLITPMAATSTCLAAFVLSLFFPNRKVKEAKPLFWNEVVSSSTEA